jgi:putative ABC transport system substrate-binding protein
LIVLVVAFGFVPAERPQLKKIPRIGTSVSGSASAQAPCLEAFRQGLRDLRYAEGENIGIEHI